MKKQSVATTAQVVRTPVARAFSFGGLAKFGFTPGGGARAGPLKSILYMTDGPGHTDRERKGKRRFFSPESGGDFKKSLFIEKDVWRGKEKP